MTPRFSIYPVKRTWVVRIPIEVKRLCLLLDEFPFVLQAD